MLGTKLQYQHKHISIHGVFTIRGNDVNHERGLWQLCKCAKDLMNY